MHSKCMMRPDLIVLPEPDVDGDLGLFGAVEPICIQHFPTECSVEALVVFVSPWAAWIDLHWLNVDPSEPILRLRGNEFGAIIGADELRLPMLHQQPVHNVQNIACVHL